VNTFQAGLIAARLPTFPRFDELSGVDCWVMVVMFQPAKQEEPTAFQSTNKVAARAGISQTTVKASQKHLESAGAIVVHRRAHRQPTHHRLHPFFLPRNQASTSGPKAAPSRPEKPDGPPAASPRPHLPPGISEDLPPGISAAEIAAEDHDEEMPEDPDEAFAKGQWWLDDEVNR
jgi:biotin operon repressor